MSIISIFAGSYCDEEAVIKAIVERTGYVRLQDSDIISKAAMLFDFPEGKLARVFTSRTSLFNQFTHERERSISYLKAATAEVLSERKDGLVMSGFTSLLIPASVSHSLKICIIADMPYRVSIAVKTGLDEPDALKVLHRSDEERIAWVKEVLGKDDPWDVSIYDMILPTDKLSIERIGVMVSESLGKEVVVFSPSSEKAIRNFLLVARVEAALAREGYYYVDASLDNDALTLTINKNVLMLKRLEDDLKATAGKVEGIKSITTQVGSKFHQSDIVRKYDLEMPTKLLLVDDERQFVQRLSERLLYRDIGSAVAYDGESALRIVHEEEPEVMILDLKMPGIDGIEVLKRVKQTNPAMEVIILTGQGSEKDREVCMQLGAFAYLEKPVDVEVLSDNIKKANEKIRRRSA